MNVIENVNRFSDFVEDKLHHASNEFLSFFFVGMVCWYSWYSLSHQKIIKIFVQVSDW